MSWKQCRTPVSEELVSPEPRSARARPMWDLPVAAALCVLVSLLALGMVSRVYVDADLDKERVFLDQKLETLLLEVRSIAQKSISAEDLHAWDDGGDLVPSLSLQKQNGDWLDPADPFSGNRAVGNQWLYARRLSIEKIAGQGQEALRMAKVEIFRFEKKRGYVLVRARRQVLGAGPIYEDRARVLDLYVLAIQNSPIPLGNTETLRARFESRLLDLEARNPGIRIRTHWITKLAFGRDPCYRPATLQKDQEGEAPAAYRYPVGYDLEPLLDDRDDSLRYSLADSRNHTLRLPEARALFERRVRAGLEDAEEPTWRLLLEDLLAHPELYRDAMILNLHGETLPLPPLRNYSDAAKIPEQDRGLRVVSHPEKIRFDDGRSGGEAEDVRLRVYAWRTEPGSPDSEALGGGESCIVLRIPGLDLRAPAVEGEPGVLVEFLAGGRQADGSLRPYSPFAKARPWSGKREEAGYELSYVAASTATSTLGEDYTEIRLHGTPTSCEMVGEGGLDAGQRLYGLDYIPLPVEKAGDFSQDLASAGKVPKNTARWRISIPASLLRQKMGKRRIVEVQTSIGEPGSFGSWNRSLTWTWWTSDPDSVPLTERFQFLGDPRHNPYADLCDGGEDYPSGYNWFFDDLRADGQDARKAWPALSRVEFEDGWMGRSSLDLPRYFLILREALRRSHALFVQGPGPLAFAVSLGGEDGTQAPGLLAAREGSWWSRPWLGELFPDDYAELWREEGNLPLEEFEIVARESIRKGLPVGTSLAPENRRAGFEGSTSFMNSGVDWATFHYQRVSSQSSRWTEDGVDLVRRWALAPGPRPRLQLPFRLRTSWHGSVGPERPWQALFPRQRLVLAKSFLAHDRGALGFALLSLSQPGSEGRASFLLNGFDPDLDMDTGVDFILSASVDSLLQGLQERGELLPLPRIEKAAFLSATKIQLVFDLAWPRSPDTQTVKRLEPLEERVKYRCLYSSDGGRTFRRLMDDVTTVPDRPLADPKEWLLDKRIGPESQQFEIAPAKSAESMEPGWIIRVEAWLDGRKLHHAYHQRRIFHDS